MDHVDGQIINTLLNARDVLPQNLLLELVILIIFGINIQVMPIKNTMKSNTAKWIVQQLILSVLHASGEELNLQVMHHLQILLM
jgi:hypothetical protein